MTLAVSGWYRLKHIFGGHPTTPCWICHRTGRQPMM